MYSTCWLMLPFRVVIYEVLPKWSVFSQHYKTQKPSNYAWFFILFTCSTLWARAGRIALAFAVIHARTSGGSQARWLRKLVYFRNIYNLTANRRTPHMTKNNQYFLYSKIKPNCFSLLENFIIKPIKTNTAGAKIHLNFSYIIIISAILLIWKNILMKQL